MIKCKDRTVNGKLKGRYYTMPNGTKLYLEHVSGEKTRALDFKTNSWILPVSTVRQAEHFGCTAIGVFHKIGKKTATYIAPLSHYLNEPSVVHWESNKEPARKLNRNLFVTNSTKTAEHIEKSLKIS